MKWWLGTEGKEKKMPQVSETKVALLHRGYQWKVTTAYKQNEMGEERSSIKCLTTLKNLEGWGGGFYIMLFLKSWLYGFCIFCK